MIDTVCGTVLWESRTEAGNWEGHARFKVLGVLGIYCTLLAIMGKVLVMITCYILLSVDMYSTCLLSTLYSLRILCLCLLIWF